MSLETISRRLCVGRRSLHILLEVRIEASTLEVESNLQKALHFMVTKSVLESSCTHETLIVFFKAFTLLMYIVR